jgi:hypothetical protein
VIKFNKDDDDGGEDTDDDDVRKDRGFGRTELDDGAGRFRVNVAIYSTIEHDICE